VCTLNRDNVISCEVIPKDGDTEKECKKPAIQQKTTDDDDDDGGGGGGGCGGGGGGDGAIEHGTLDLTINRGHPYKLYKPRNCSSFLLQYSHCKCTE